MATNKDPQDILIKGGIIRDIGTKITVDKIPTIDANFHFVTPPFVDSHFHNDAFGRTTEENIEFRSWSSNRKSITSFELIFYEEYVSSGRCEGLGFKQTYRRCH